MKHLETKSQYYRRKAAEAHEKAAGMRDFAARQAMQQVATTYEQLAQMAVRHEAANSNEHIA